MKTNFLNIFMQTVVPLLLYVAVQSAIKIASANLFSNSKLHLDGLELPKMLNYLFAEQLIQVSAVDHFRLRKYHIFPKVTG